MRCCCCNRNLNDYESTLRSVATGDFLDMCKTCIKDLNIKTKKNSMHDPDAEAPDDTENYCDLEDTLGQPFTEEWDQE